MSDCANKKLPDVNPLFQGWMFFMLDGLSWLSLLAHERLNLGASFTILELTIDTHEGIRKKLYWQNVLEQVFLPNINLYKYSPYIQKI